MYDDDQAAEALDTVREDLQVGANVDPLEALLNVSKTVEDVRETFDVPLVDGVKVPWTVRAVESDEIDAARERNTRWVKPGRGARIQELDEQAMTRQLIALATITPDLNNSSVKAKFGATRPEQVVRKALLPGTQDALLQKIMEISGYADDLVALGKS